VTCQEWQGGARNPAGRISSIAWFGPIGYTCRLEPHLLWSMFAAGKVPNHRGLPFRDDRHMKIHGQAVAAALAILLSAALAQLLVPRELMARASESFDLETIIPRQFGEWTLVPGVRLVLPTDPNALERQLYSQELARGYVDRDGHNVMLLVAYGPSQSDRLQLHRPEICYAAGGFRVSGMFQAQVPFRDDAPPLKLKRLTAQREARLEPISYWMRIGGDIASGVFDSKFVRLKYGLRGIIADGTLVRISSIGLPEQVAYAVQDRFIRDLFTAVDPKDLKYLIGDLGGPPRRQAQAEFGVPPS
jgi:EpsI family protein